MASQAEDHSDVLANFVAITGQDEAAALGMLQACDWDLTAAVELFYATGGADMPGTSSGSRQQPPARPAPMEEEEVRAPLPTKVDRLYDPSASMLAGGRGDGLGAQYAYGLRGPPRPQAVVDVFRDAKAEGKAGSNGAGAGAAGSASLSDMYKPPASILHLGDFTSAKEAAGRQGKWLLLNVQDVSQFASHRLNRDTWSHEAVQLLLAKDGMFVFYQVHDTTPEGRHLISSYRLGSLPAIAVIDPLTGIKLLERVGFIDAERLMEELVPFLDHGPKDPKAGALAAQMAQKRRVPQAAAPAGGGGTSSSKPLTEDEQLAMALAMSMEQQPGGSGGGGQEAVMVDGEDDDDDIDEAAIWEQIRAKEAAEREAAARPSPEQVLAEATARLPAEPGDSEPGAVRVALRMPDGSRLQRRFLYSHTIQALYDLVLVHLPEAAQGKHFTVSMATPGAQPLADMTATLKNAGVAGALLAVKWADS